MQNQTTVLAIFGLESAEQHLSAGTELRRAFLFDMWNRPSVAVQFLRRPGSDPTVTVHLPQGATGSPAREPLSVSVPLRDWQRIAERGRNFDRTLMPVVRQPPRPGDDDAIVICSDGGTVIVEAVGRWWADSALRLRRRVEGTCEHGLADELATDLAEAAAQVLPPCGALDRMRFGDGWGVVEVCAMLRGDRMTAALVLNRAAELRDRPEDREAVARLIDSRAVFDWQGNQIGPGAGQRYWIERMSGERPPYLSITSVSGQSTERVLLTGILRRWTETPSGQSQLFHAPVTQTWIAEFGTFRLHQMTVGPDELIPDACPPGMLTGAYEPRNCRR